MEKPGFEFDGPQHKPFVVANKVAWAAVYGWFLRAGILIAIALGGAVLIGLKLAIAR